MYKSNTYKNKFKIQNTKTLATNSEYLGVQIKYVQKHILQDEQ